MNNISDLTDEQVFAELMKRCDIEPFVTKRSQIYYSDITFDYPFEIEFGFDYNGKFIKFEVNE